MSQYRSKRAGPALAAGAALFMSMSVTAAARAAEPITLHAIFLPATWGTVVKNTLAPEYEKETGVKVDVDLIGRDAIHEKMATLFAAGELEFRHFQSRLQLDPRIRRRRPSAPDG